MPNLSSLDLLKWTKDSTFFSKTTRLCVPTWCWTAVWLSAIASLKFPDLKTRNKTTTRSKFGIAISKPVHYFSPYHPQPYFTTRIIPPARDTLRLDVRLFRHLVFLLFCASPSGGQIEQQGQQEHEVCCVHHLSPQGKPAGRVSEEVTQI
jgi:hypothetical protein